MMLTSYNQNMKGKIESATKTHRQEKTILTITTKKEIKKTKADISFS